MPKKKIKVILIDMDGTLYPIQEESFLLSPVHNEIQRRSIEFISKSLNINPEKSRKIFIEIKKDYPKLYSVGLKERYGINRKKYLDYSWNINPRDFVKLPKGIKNLLSELCKKYSLYLVSDAPEVWINNLLRNFDIENLFTGKFSGTDLNREKKEGLFIHVLKTLNLSPNNVIMIGDEKDTDMIPAKNSGISTIFLGSEKEFKADYNIRSIFDLKNILL